MKHKKNKKFKKLNKMTLAAIVIIGTFLIFYVGMFLGIMYELLLVTGG